LRLLYNSGSSRLVVQHGGGGTLATGSSVYTVGAWHHVIFRALISNGSGEIEVRQDGATVISQTGIDTQQTANASANTVKIGMSDNSLIHDIVICDGTGPAPYNGILGDVRVNCLIPNAAGASSAWTPSAGANYQNVDDTTPDTDGTYNATLTAGAIDSYSVPNPTLTGICRGVAVAALVRKDDAGTRTLRPILHDAGVPANYQGTARNLADSYAFHEDVWQVHPGTGVDFTQTQLNNAQPGVQLVS
jgi:hypothetical protein